MICYSCGHCSQHVRCPYCAAKTEVQGNIRVGFSLSDVPNPFSYAYDLGKSAGSAISRGSSSPSSDSGPSLWDRLPSIPNPFSTAYDAGKSIGDTVKTTIQDTVKTTIQGPADAISSFMSVLKWVVIGGAIVGAIVILYGVIKFVPVALGIAGSTAHETTKMIPHILKASV